jgi:hypothetical protein
VSKRPAGDEIILQNLDAIREGVERRRSLGDPLSVLAALIHERDGVVTTSIVTRRALRVTGPSRRFEDAVARATKDDRDDLLIVIGLPTSRAVVWLDPTALPHGGVDLVQQANDASRRNSN